MSIKRRTIMLFMLISLLISMLQQPVVFGNERQTQAQDITIDLAWRHDGQQIATIHSSGDSFIWDADSMRMLNTLSLHRDIGTSIVWSPDNQQLITTSWDGSAVIWDSLTQQPVHQLMHESEVLAAIWSADGQEIITGSVFGSSTLTIWDSNLGAKVAGYEMGTLQNLSWDFSKTRIAAANPSGFVQIISGNNLDLLKRYREVSFDDPEENTSILRVAWHPTGKTIASGNAIGEVRIRDVETGEILSVFQATERPKTSLTSHFVIDLAFSADGEQLYSTTADGTLRLWEVASGRLIEETQLNHALSAADWSPYLGRLAYGILTQEGEAAPQRDLAASDVQIIVPFASAERLNRLTADCIADADNPGAAAEQLSMDAAPADLIAQVNALRADVIPPACRADLLAVANHLVNAGAGER